MTLQVRALAKAFAADPVLRGLDLDVKSHATLAVLGRSGAGKTTLLKVLAGLEPPDRGSVRLEGRDVTAEPPQRRGVLYLSQEPLLFPHRDVSGNLAFGLELRGVPAAERESRVASMLERLGIFEHARKRPHQLSGGQRQRVAFGRALIVNPPLLLLDEPFGSLDSTTRTAMQELFVEVAHEYRITSLFVTHDLKEAIRVGDRWAHLVDGRLRLFDALDELVADERVGVGEEIEFWRQVADGRSPRLGE